MDYRPDLQAISRRPQKKFNAATSNNRDQMESESSELEEVGPISGSADGIQRCLVLPPVETLTEIAVEVVSPTAARHY